MFKGVIVTGLAGALCIVALPADSSAAAAKGSGAHVSRSGPAYLTRVAPRHRHGFRHYHRQADYLFAGYDYSAPAASGDADIDDAYPADVIADAPTFQCHYNRETVTVRSESGGTRRVTITRC